MIFKAIWLTALPAKKTMDYRRLYYVRNVTALAVFFFDARIAWKDTISVVGPEIQIRPVRVCHSNVKTQKVPALNRLALV